MKYALTILVVALSAPRAFAVDATCAGCDQLKSLSAKFATLKTGDDDHALPLIQKSSSVIEKMGKKLSPAQIHEITSLAAAEYRNDPGYAVVGNTLEIFKANSNAFYAEFKKLKKPLSDELTSELDIVLGEDQNGNGGDDDPEPILPAPKKAVKK